MRTWLDRGELVTVLDVRTPAEFETAHIRGSLNVPLPVVEEHAAALAERLDRQVVLVCQSGTRARQACLHLAGAGVERLHVLDGGVGAFQDAGGQVERGRARWAMERQARLAAGSVVLASVLASLRVPGARFLAGGIGAGPTISALTDTCTMSRVLAALPHDRGPAALTASEVLDQLPRPRAA